MQVPKLGEILIDQGVLTYEQVTRVLARQMYDDRPFGQIAADAFDIEERVIWQTVAEQVLMNAESVNISTETWTKEALRAISAHDAWTYRLLPLRYEHGELVIATSAYELPGALSLIEREVYDNHRIVIADAKVLEQTIAERYATAHGKPDKPEVPWMNGSGSESASL